ncbi:hypothetical protein KBY55_09375 [Streptomyces sp. b94]|uniref:hypothetical protein n=1 Tax=Streptomyces sp. b94 TaxID=1827634 RepID=UPI001B37ACC2|nr:hypothetical protein [Streptomyces sp. b94]MBQ1096294.1 hypothetical protein [Streptomyces sp. b94]
MISPLAMTAKKVIEAAWFNGPTYDMATEAAEALESAQLLQDPETIVALRTEAGAAAEAYDGELKMFRFLVRVLRIAARNEDLAEVQRLLWQHADDESAAYAEAREKSSRPAADATPESAREQRLTQLLDTIRTHRGEWRAGDVVVLRRLAGGPTQRSVARRDLAELHHRGHLNQHGPTDSRFYTLKRKRTRGGDER